MFKKKFVRDLTDVKRGFGYFFRGARYLLRHRELWSLLVLPVLMNVLLFVLFVWGLFALTHRFFLLELPPTWWGVLLGAVLVLALIGAVLFLGSAVFVFFGSVISAPFYDVLAERVARAEGAVVPDHPWWKGVGKVMRHSLQHLWWYVLIQIGIVILFFVPGAFGPISYVTLGFFSTTFFLSIDFLDYSFDFRGWDFSDRRKWCMERKGLVFGFGTAVFLGLGIPVFNVLIPPMAIIGSILMFQDNSDL